MAVKLQYGDTGKEVFELQNRLNLLLPRTITPDGHYGQQTRDAVKEYQRLNFCTGYVSDYLWDLIGKEYEDAKNKDESEEVTVNPEKDVPKELLLKRFSGGEQNYGSFIWTPTGNQSSRKGYGPVAIVLHYTVSTSLQGTINWFKKTNHSGVSSSHFIVDYDGTIVKMVNLEDCAWHAGGTTLPDGYQLTNQRSIGIEIENWGKLRKQGNKLLHPYVNIEYDKDLYGTPHVDENGDSWMPYTKEQVDATMNICKVMVEHYDMKWIVGHEDIAKHADGRKWKFDPGPAFPMDKFQKLIK